MTITDGRTTRDRLIRVTTNQNWPEIAMLNVRICSTDGDVIAEGTCSDSGYFPIALASVYNAALKRVPARTVESFGGAWESADYPVGTRRASFGYTPRGGGGAERVLDDEVIVHIERT